MSIQDTAQSIAEDAIFELSVCRTLLQQMLALMHVVKQELPHLSNARQVLEMAGAHVESVSSNADVNEEALEKRLRELPAPQNDDLVNRGAMIEDGNLGRRIKEARKQARLTQAELANLVGLEQASICQLEVGTTKRTAYLPEISLACGVDIEWLAFGMEAVQ